MCSLKRDRHVDAYDFPVGIANFVPNLYQEVSLWMDTEFDAGWLEGLEKDQGRLYMLLKILVC